MSWSQKERFNGCPLAYKYHYVDGIRKSTQDERANDRSWGSAIHEALEVFYKTSDMEEGLKRFRVAYPENLDRFDKVKTIAHGLETLLRYERHWKEQDKLWEVIGAECNGEVEVLGSVHRVVLDLVARNKQTGDIYFWDHKTTISAQNYKRAKGFELNGQISLYTIYVEEKYGECAGGIINNIQVKHLLRKNKYGEGPGLVVNFDRQVYQRTPEQIGYFKKSMSDWSKLIEVCKKENVWPGAFNHGCSYCDFYELCLSSGNEQIRDTIYGQALKELKVEIK